MSVENPEFETPENKVEKKEELKPLSDEELKKWGALRFFVGGDITSYLNFERLSDKEKRELSEWGDGIATQELLNDKQRRAFTHAQFKFDKSDKSNSRVYQVGFEREMNKLSDKEKEAFLQRLEEFNGRRIAEIRKLQGWGPGEEQEDWLKHQKEGKTAEFEAKKAAIKEEWDKLSPEGKEARSGRLDKLFLYNIPGTRTEKERREEFGKLMEEQKEKEEEK